MHHAIDVANLKKRYRVYFEKPALIKNILPFLVAQGKAQEFWALDDVSFTVDKGECVGIIGPNGSGKSTILSVLAGVTAPTEGAVSVSGRVSSLLSLGAGFNFELTGQENVFLNGAILGLSKSQIDKIYRDIVDFADLGKFMNAKLSTYSSGMNMRLGFAIAVMTSFDVLLIDEILAVGDLSFQTKCFRAMKRFYEDEGKTIVLVSHDLEKIAELCSRVIWFEHGRIEAMGEPGEVIEGYKERYREKFRLGPSMKAPPRGAGTAAVAVDAGRTVRRIPETIFGSNADAFSDGSWLYDSAGRRMNEGVLAALEPLGFRLFRYPGMYNADYFRWRETVGAERLPQVCGAQPAKPKIAVGFGPAELLELCGALGAAPMITLNAGSGTPEEAAGWVSWVRERYGGPLHVEIGHELYYDDFHHLGVDFPWTGERYARAFAVFARAVRAADPGARIGAQCCLENGAFRRYRDPGWNEAVLSIPRELFDYLSLHNASLPILNITPDYRTPNEPDSYGALIAAPAFVEEGLAALAAQAGTAVDGDGVPIALSEYGCFFTPVPAVVHGARKVHDRSSDSTEWGRNQTLAAALYEAGVLHACMRRPEVFLAARMGLFSDILSAVLNRGAGWELVRLPQYHVHSMLNRFAGKILLHAECSGAATSHPAVGFVPARAETPCCDAVCVRDETGGRLALSVINRSVDTPLQMRLDLKGFNARYCTVRTLSGETPDCGSRLLGSRQAGLGQYTIRTADIRRDDGMLYYSLPRHSLSVISYSDDDWI